MCSCAGFQCQQGTLAVKAASVACEDAACVVASVPASLTAPTPAGATVATAAAAASILLRAFLAGVLAGDEVRGEAVADSARAIDREASRMSRIVRQLLDFARRMLENPSGRLGEVGESLD